MRLLRASLKKLINFVSSSELMQFNSQIVSYMAEQLVHRSALNGNLKFACEVLRKKYSVGQEASSSLLIECKNLEAVEQQSLGDMSESGQDERIFKLASELLLSDEGSLRKLSAQVLNEAQHLAQLECILNTLRKIRWKHLKLRSKERLERCVEETEAVCEEEEEESGSEGEECGEEKLEEEKLDRILEVIRSVFVEHKIKVSEQLTEMQKIMSMTVDDDLLTHLQ